MLLSKKGVSEITSFVLITLLVVTTSIIVYHFSKSFIEDTVSENDLKNIEIYFENLIQKTNQIQTFDGQSFAMGLSFNYGLLVFENNSLYYQSMKSSSDANNYCSNQLCFVNVNSGQRIYFNLSNNYTFIDNVTLVPGNYYLIFKNNKNASKIDFTFR